MTRTDGRRPSAQDARWDEVVDLVIAELPDIADQFVARVRRIPGYDETSLVPGEDLRETAVAVLGTLARCMKSTVSAADSHELLSVATELGVRRARQGVPPEALATAVQLDFGVIWAELLELCGPRDAILLTTHVETVWRMVDRFASQTQSSYADERSRLAQEEANLQQSIVSRLFTAPVLSASVVARVGRDLGLDVDTAYAMLVADHADAQDQLHRLANDRLHPRYFAYRTAGMTISFWPHATYPRELHRLAATLTAVYVPEVVGLRQVVPTSRAAMALLEVRDPTATGPITLDDGIPLLARNALRGLDIDLDARLTAALEPCTPQEQERIRETVVAFLESGSAQTTASQLFCHRNTVLNRLSRFADLTGVDLTIPRQAAVVALAWCPEVAAPHP